MLNTADECVPAAELIKAFGYRCWRLSAALYSPENYNQWPNDIFDGARTVMLLAIPEESDRPVRQPNAVLV